jgi:hypothetical protein
MRNNIIVLIISFFILIFLVNCICKNTKKENEEKMYELTFEIAEHLNKNSKLPFTLLEMLNLPEEETKKYGPDYPYIVENDDNDVRAYYFNYPFNSNNLRLTQIEIKSSNYNIYGVKIGDDISSVEKIMKNNNFKIDNIPYYYEETNTKNYSKYHLEIYFITKEDSGKISEILVTISDPEEPNDLMY